MATKKVFISYSHDNEDHKDWVRTFAEDLVQNGVEVLLDQWYLHIGDDLGFFMEQSLSQSDYILLVCTPNFAYKVNNRLGGISYEADLVVGNILTRPNYKAKFIPLLRKGVPSESVPMFLTSRLFVDFEDDSKYQQSLDVLLRRIFDAPMYVPPELGRAPVYATKYSNYNSISQTPSAKILVAGLGRVRDLTENITSISKQVGKKLAQNKFGLVTGGWPGVDEIVAREYSEELLRLNLPLEDYLTQIIVKKYLPVYTGGNLILIDEGDSEWADPVLNSDALVLINGIGGTYTTGKYGIKFNKPVFPVADSGGDARKMYMEILTSWGQYSYRNIQKIQFQRLGGPLNYSLDALITLLNMHFG